jgi:hypothetical protein
MTTGLIRLTGNIKPFAVSVMDIFNSAPRRRYGDRLYISPIIHDNFLQTMQKPSGMHHNIGGEEGS